MASISFPFSSACTVIQAKSNSSVVKAITEETSLIILFLINISSWTLFTALTYQASLAFSSGHFKILF